MAWLFLGCWSKVETSWLLELPRLQEHEQIIVDEFVTSSGPTLQYSSLEEFPYPMVGLAHQLFNE